MHPRENAIFVWLARLLMGASGPPSRSPTQNLCVPSLQNVFVLLLHNAELMFSLPTSDKAPAPMGSCGYGCWRASERLLKAPSADALVYPTAAARHLYLDAKK